MIGGDLSLTPIALVLQAAWNSAAEGRWNASDDLFTFHQPGTCSSRIATGIPVADNESAFVDGLPSSPGVLEQTLMISDCKKKFITHVDDNKLINIRSVSDTAVPHAYAIFTIAGQLVAEGIFADAFATIEAQALSSGIYFLVLETRGADMRQEIHRLALAR